MDTTSVGGTDGSCVTPRNNGLRTFQPFKKPKKKKFSSKDAVHAWLNPVNMSEKYVKAMNEARKIKFYAAKISYNNATIANGDVVAAHKPEEVVEYWTELAVNRLFKGHITKEEFNEYYEKHPGEFEIAEVDWNNDEEIAKRAVIGEGGNAVDGVSRLNVANVTATIKDVFKRALPALGLKKSDVRILGSAGKKSSGSHGDLDIGVSLQALVKNNNLGSADDVWEFLTQALYRMSTSVKAMRGIGTVSCAWPITSSDGLQDGEFVQVDFMVADSIDWLAFKNFSPSDVESKFKGVHRNLLLVAIAKYASYQVRKENNGTPVEWEKWTINVSGLAKNVETNLGKNGNIVKSKRVIDQTILTKDPKEAVEMILGPGYTVADCNSFESLYKIVMSPNFRLKQFKEQILQETAKGIHSLGFPVPEVCAGYI